MKILTLIVFLLFSNSYLIAESSHDHSDAKALEECEVCVKDRNPAYLGKTDKLCEKCKETGVECKSGCAFDENCDCEEKLGGTARAVLAGVVIGFSTFMLFVIYFLKKRLEEAQQ